MLEDSENTCILQPNSTIISTLPASAGQAVGSLVKVERGSYQGNSLQDSLTIKEPNITSRQQPCLDTFVKVEEDGYQDDLLEDSLLVEDSIDSQQQSHKDSDKFASFPEESQLCNRDLLANLPFLKSGHEKTQRDKQMLPLNSKLCVFLRLVSYYEKKTLIIVYLCNMIDI